MTEMYCVRAAVELFPGGTKLLAFRRVAFSLCGEDTTQRSENAKVNMPSDQAAGLKGSQTSRPRKYNAATKYIQRYEFT